MAQHSNYAKDRDLMMEAYGSVEGIIPPTQSTAPARLYTEAHCDEEHEGGEETVKVELELELDKETAKKLHDQLMPEVTGEEEVPAEDSSCASNEEEHAEDGEHEEGEHAESPFPTADHDAPEGGIGSRSMDEAEDGEHVPAEDSSCASHSDEEHTDEEKDEEEDEEVVAESYTAQYLLK